MKLYELSDEAEFNLMLIAITIEHNFSLKRAERYQTELASAILRICENPNRWPIMFIENGISVRKYVFQEKTIILYSEREGFISIDVIADARTDWKE